MEELLRNVTAIRDGTAQTGAASALQACSTNDRLPEYKEPFYSTTAFRKYSISGICLPVTATHEDDSSENSTIYPYVGVAADYTVWSPLGDTRREFLILFVTYMKHV